jgi:hypothetical protein
MALTPDEQADKQAKKSASDYVVRGLVYIAARDERGGLNGGGSGSLWRSSSGRVLALTAKHVVNGHRSFTVGGMGGQERLRAARIVEHASLDIAAVELTDARFASFAFSETQSEVEEQAASPFARVGIKPGRRFMKKPIGISGGAVWLWRRVNATTLWLPSRALTMVGPIEFNNKRELAVPVSRWRQWFIDQLNA